MTLVSLLKVADSDDLTNELPVAAGCLPSGDQSKLKMLSGYVVILPAE